MPRLRPAAVALLLIALATGLGVGPSSAQEPGPALTIRSVDATDPANVEVTFSYTGDRNDLADLTVRESGDLVEAATAVPLSERRALGVVLVLDVSGSMGDNGLIEPVLDAATGFVEAKAPSDQIALVTFSGEVRLIEDFTTDKDVLLEALASQPLADDTSLYDGIVRGAALFEDSELQPNVVVFSDGGDTTSVATAERAQAALDSVGAALFALGAENQEFQVLERMAAATGGSSAFATDPADVDELFGQVQADLQRQYVTTFPSRAAGQTVELTLSVAGEQATVEFVSGTASEGSASLEPQPIESPSGPSFLREKTGLLIGVGLLALAAFVAVLSLGTTFLGREHTLTQTLQPYSEGYVASGEFDVDDGGDGRAQQMATSPILQRAVAATGDFAQRQGLLTKVESLLERANLALRPAEAIFFYLVGLVIVTALLSMTPKA